MKTAKPPCGKPNFFIVGAAKAGTTSLYSWLKAHPLVYMPSLKEPYFFGTHVSPKMGFPGQRYRSLERYLSLFAGARNHLAIGEASTSYLWDPDAPRQIKDFCKDARIIILLRDPVDRAFSHYLMDIRNGLQPLPFYEALIDDYYNSSKLFGEGHLYVELGLYSEQVKRYLQTFGRDQILILLFPDLRRDPAKVLKRTLDFLGLPEDSMPWDQTLEVKNPFSLPRNRLTRWILRWLLRMMAIGAIEPLVELIPPQVRSFVYSKILLRPAPKPPRDSRGVDFLLQFYDEDVTKLEDILGSPLPELRITWPKG